MTARRNRVRRSRAPSHGCPCRGDHAVQLDVRLDRLFPGEATRPRDRPASARKAPARRDIVAGQAAVRPAASTSVASTGSRGPRRRRPRRAGAPRGHEGRSACQRLQGGHPEALLERRVGDRARPGGTTRERRRRRRSRSGRRGLRHRSPQWHRARQWAPQPSPPTSASRRSGCVVAERREGVDERRDVLAGLDRADERDVRRPDAVRREHARDRRRHRRPAGTGRVIDAVPARRATGPRGGATAARRLAVYSRDAHDAGRRVERSPDHAAEVRRPCCARATPDGRRTSGRGSSPWPGSRCEAASCSAGRARRSARSRSASSAARGLFPREARAVATPAGPRRAPRPGCERAQRTVVVAAVTRDGVSTAARRGDPRRVRTCSTPAPAGRAGTAETSRSTRTRAQSKSQRLRQRCRAAALRNASTWATADASQVSGSTRGSDLARCELAAQLAVVEERVRRASVQHVDIAGTEEEAGIADDLGERASRRRRRAVPARALRAPGVRSLRSGKRCNNTARAGRARRRPRHGCGPNTLHAGPVETDDVTPSLRSDDHELEVGSPAPQPLQRGDDGR